MSLPELHLGSRYSKNDLAELLKHESLKTVREGIAYLNDRGLAILFVDLEKGGKEERFRFNDSFDGEHFHWDSQTTQHIDSPSIQRIVKGELEPHLFVRINRKVKSKTQPFVYCGELEYLSHDPETSNPVHLVFHSKDYDDFTENENLQDIYLWKSGASKEENKYVDSYVNKVSSRRKKKYSKPNSTERKGLVTSRVGQGYYRQQLLEKFRGKCPLTGCSIRSILIASHIIPWSEADDSQRLDPENGILLSPNADALFDKHLISFDDNGELLISSKISSQELSNLGIREDAVIPVSEGMKKYLKIHHEKLK